MKALLWKTGLAACLTLGLWHGQASAEAATGNACSQFGTVKAKQNPAYQHINCLLTEAAISADIPPEVVKAVATQENGSWQQFTDKGAPVVSADGGIGLMQLTNKTGYDQDRLKNDIAYNIKAGAEVLSQMYARKDLPKIKAANRDVIENWYFPVLAYNGTKPVNSPLYQETGKTNTNAYQEKVFAALEKQSLMGGKLADYPFNISDFDYDRNSSANITFKKLSYPVAGTHQSVYSFKKGKKAVATANVNIRTKPDTSSSKVETVKRGAVLTINGSFAYTSTATRANQFVWYPVITAGGKKGYVSSAYVEDVTTTLIPDQVKPVVTGAGAKSIAMNASFKPTSGVKASDDRDGNLTSKIKVTGTVNTKKKGTYTLTYTVTDKAGNKTSVKRKITVYDKVKPVISGAKNKTIRLKSSFNPKSGITAKDNADGNLTSKIKVSGRVNTKKKGTYKLTYTVTDSSKNTAKITRKITVK